MRAERPSHTLQPTALVHEAYLRMFCSRSVDWKDRSHFLGFAARVMRQILVDYARGNHALKRGGPYQKIHLDEALVFSSEKSNALLALDEALHDLEKLDPRQSRIVELRFFTGLSVAETAEVVGISTSTVKQEWAMARVWLYRRISRNHCARVAL
jgi:RNA polymerase sigma factor (TIGR02999 family)